MARVEDFFVLQQKNTKQVVSEVNSVQSPKLRVQPNTKDTTFMKTLSF